MSEERKQRLDAIGFTWRLNETIPPIPWDEMLERLKAYKEKHGNFRVGNDKEHARLRNWVATQKALYAKKTLPEDRVTKLNALGFCWGKTYKKSKRSLSPSKDRDGEAQLAAKRQKGTTMPSQTTTPAAFELPPPLAAATMEDPSARAAAEETITGTGAVYV